MYRGMTISAEKADNGVIYYRVIRFKNDGTVSETPWTWKSIDGAKNYIEAHGF